MLHTQVMVKKTITFSIDTEVHRDFEQAVKEFESIFGPHKKQFFYNSAFVFLTNFIKTKQYEKQSESKKVRR